MYIQQAKFESGFYTVVSKTAWSKLRRSFKSVQGKFYSARFSSYISRSNDFTSVSNV